jgi:hypothetical protein
MLYINCDLDTLIVKKVEFVAFIDTVIKCTTKESKKLDMLISAAEKVLGLQYIMAETLQGLLSLGNVPPSQDPSQVVFYWVTFT